MAIPDYMSILCVYTSSKIYYQWFRPWRKAEVPTIKQCLKTEIMKSSTSVFICNHHSMKPQLLFFPANNKHSTTRNIGQSKHGQNIFLFSVVRYCLHIKLKSAWKLQHRVNYLDVWSIPLQDIYKHLDGWISKCFFWTFNFDVYSHSSS